MSDERCNRCENMYHQCCKCQGQQHQWFYHEPPVDMWLCDFCGAVLHHEPEIVQITSSHNTTTWVDVPEAVFTA